MDKNYRPLSASEIISLEKNGCTAADWGRVRVAEGFAADWVRGAHFGGDVLLGANGGRICCAGGVVRNSGIYNASLYNCTVGDGALVSNIGRYIANYDIGEDVVIENVGQISCEGSSSFGNGVEVAAVNEGGGREVPICCGLTAQIAYITAMYRHRARTVGLICGMIGAKTRKIVSARGTIARGALIVNANTLIDVFVGEYARINGASSLSNGTIDSSKESPSFVGGEVVASDFVMARSSTVDTGTMLRKCFVGEGVCLESRFAAENSLFFANCHCSNGEACAVFAGPYCVTHHRATLLIAGYFSFFNAGSGANQSNHLYRTGPVHQGIHLRGCKLGSDAYVLLPARTGAFSIIIGRHHKHHDTVDMPFSYLMEENDASYLFPAANLHSYGTLRDVRKWPKRDRRVGVAGDIVDSDMFSPYIGGQLLKAIGVCRGLLAVHGGQDVVTWNRVRIKTILLRKGIKIYTQALRGYLAELLEGYDGSWKDNGLHEWADLSGMIAPRERIDAMLDAVDRGEIATYEELDDAIRAIHAHYAEDTRGWAVYAASVLLGKQPEELTADDVAELVEQGAKDREAMKAIVEADAERDFGAVMAVGYGIDSSDKSVRKADFDAVRRR